MNLVFFGLFSIIGCGYERFQKRLDSQEFSHYYALRVYMPEESRKAYLKMKTREERDAYLKKLGLWDRFYKYEQEERDEIIAGGVEGRKLLEDQGTNLHEVEEAMGFLFLDTLQATCLEFGFSQVQVP